MDEFHGWLSLECARVYGNFSRTGKFGDKFFNELRRKTYTTPKSFLDMVELYIVMLSEKRGELKTQRDRLSVGVTKLVETNAIVESLQTELTALAPVLKQKGEEAEIMIANVTKEGDAAQIVKVKVEADELRVGKQAAEVKIVADDAQADLGKYSSEGAAREWSTVVDISIPPPSFKLVPLSSARSPLFKTPKQVFF